MIPYRMNELLKMHLPVSENLAWNQQQPFLKAENHPHLPIFTRKSACKVLLYNSSQQYLGLGIFSPEQAQISFVSKMEPDLLIHQLSEKLSCQWKQRNRSDTNALRLIHHKEDGLPGVCIDLLDHTAVIQTSESGADLLIDDLTFSLLKIPEITSVYLKNTQRRRSKFNLHLQEHWLSANTAMPILRIREDSSFYEYNIENQTQIFPLHLRCIRKWFRETLDANAITNKQILLINFEVCDVLSKQHQERFNIDILSTSRMSFAEITTQLRLRANQGHRYDAIAMRTFEVNPTPKNITALHHILHALHKLKFHQQTPIVLVGVGQKTTWHQVTRNAQSSTHLKPKHTHLKETDFPQLSLFRIEL